MRAYLPVLFATAFMSSGSMVLAKTACPTREAGQAYPWQNFEPMQGDRYAIIYIDVDRSGRPLRCRIGKNNIPDPETRWRACKAYSDDWRGPPAADGEPTERTIERNFTLIGYNHQMADEKARKLWFKQHPEQRAECYPD
jgi:hypothetical protein